MNKTITLLGSTGSIGTQSLDVARMHGYSVFGLAANSSVDKLLEQINEFHPKYVAVVNPDAYARLSAIHAPTRGATLTDLGYEVQFKISIHAPTRGATDV